MRFAAYRLALRSPLHIGAGRAGMLDRTLRYVPGGVIAQSLAATLGLADGGQPAHFQAALQWVQGHLRCGPAWVSVDERILLPGRDEPRIEREVIGAQNHVTLDPGNASAVDGGLFETEMILPQAVDGASKAAVTHLAGGLWCTATEYAGQDWAAWLDRCLLGGELKIGLGRIRLVEFTFDAAAYPGIEGSADAAGLACQAGTLLPGPALDGVDQVALSPWTRRVFDVEKGFGRRFTAPRLVYLHGTVSQAARFLPTADFDTLGCWQKAG